MSSQPAELKGKLWRYYAIAAMVLAIQGGTYYALPPIADHPLKAPLTSLDSRLADWVQVRENPISPEIAVALNADATVNRDYVNTARNFPVNLFIAYFAAQRYGRWPHSPQHCMPGAGWDQRSLSTVAVPIASLTEPIRINRFILAKGEQQAIVHYWYESHNRAIASEYLAKVHLVLDSIRYRRSDTSLVRITTSVRAGEPIEAAIEDGVHFVQASFEPVRRLLN